MADPTEQRLLAAIASGDEASRLVYADWLEANGRAAQAEFMRLQLSPNQATNTHGEPDRDLLRLRELAVTTDVAWRMHVSRPVVEGCAEPACPSEWGAMVPSTQANVRKCRVCVSDVHYCMTEDELLKATGRRQHRVADVAVPRTRELCMQCGRTNERRHPFCVYCGADVQPGGPSIKRSG